VPIPRVNGEGASPEFDDVSLEALERQRPGNNADDL
jgi:hypothetical protein